MENALVVPNASRNEIIGIICDADGKNWLKIKVNAPPEDGKANKALLKFLAKHFNYDIPITPQELGWVYGAKRLATKWERRLRAA